MDKYLVQYYVIFKDEKCNMLGSSLGTVCRVDVHTKNSLLEDLRLNDTYKNLHFVDYPSAGNPEDWQLNEAIIVKGGIVKPKIKIVEKWDID
jgi:hypothetical protein